MSGERDKSPAMQGGGVAESLPPGRRVAESASPPGGRHPLGRGNPFDFEDHLPGTLSAKDRRATSTPPLRASMRNLFDHLAKGILRAALSHAGGEVYTEHEVTAAPQAVDTLFVPDPRRRRARRRMGVL